MVAEIVNLNKFRKEREKIKKDRRAEENRVRFSRSRSEKAADSIEERLRQRNLDAARIERGGEASDDGSEPDEAS